MKLNLAPENHEVELQPHPHLQSQSNYIFEIPSSRASCRSTFMGWVCVLHAEFLMLLNSVRLESKHAPNAPQVTMDAASLTRRTRHFRRHLSHPLDIGVESWLEEWHRERGGGRYRCTTHHVVRVTRFFFDNTICCS